MNGRRITAPLPPSAVLLFHPPFPLFHQDFYPFDPVDLNTRREGNQVRLRRESTGIDAVPKLKG